MQMYRVVPEMKKGNCDQSAIKNTYFSPKYFASIEFRSSYYSLLRLVFLFVLCQVLLAECNCGFVISIHCVYTLSLLKTHL